MNFTKRSDVAMFLVAQGFPVNKVKAAVDQGYNFEADSDSRDLCWRANYEEDFVANLEATKPGDTDNEHQPTFVTFEDALAMYTTFNDMMTITDAGIMIDGELMYNLNGDRLPSELNGWVPEPAPVLIKTPTLTEADAAQFRADAAKTQFAIETSNGFWNRENSTFYPTADKASYFSWLEQGDHLTEVMEEIAATKDAWFKVICITPFKN